jgi:hypothetical protein
MASLWGNEVTPNISSDDGDADSLGVVLGTRFKSAVDGNITHFRFYKVSGATGGHVGCLWTETGSFLGSKTFGDVSGDSGWLEIALDTPVSIVADTGYVVSIFCPSGNCDYPAQGSFFTSSDYVNGDLTAPQNNPGAGLLNGLYLYGPIPDPTVSGSFPTNNFNSGCYFSDLVFAAADGEQTITPGLITEAPTLHSPTVNLGALTITPGLITDGPTLHSPTVNAGAVTITPGLISNPPVVHAPSVVPGTLTVSPGLITDPPTLHNPAVSAVVTITPGLITDPATLHSPNVVLGSLTIAPGVINDSPTLHSPTVQARSLTISPGLITDPPTLHAPTVNTVVTITPGLIADPPTLHAPTVQIGALTITPGLITDLATLHPPTVIGGDEPEQIPVYVTVELSAAFPNQISLQAPIGTVIRL